MSTHPINATFGIANHSPAPSRHIGTGQALWAGSGIAAAVLLAAAGLLAAHSQPPVMPATMEIAAQPASGSPAAFFEGTRDESAPAAFFEGTGDGSAGGWTVP